MQLTKPPREQLEVNDRIVAFICNVIPSAQTVVRRRQGLGAPQVPITLERPGRQLESNFGSEDLPERWHLTAGAGALPLLAGSVNTRLFVFARIELLDDFLDPGISLIRVQADQQALVSAQDMVVPGEIYVPE